LISGNEVEGVLANLDVASAIKRPGGAEMVLPFVHCESDGLRMGRMLECKWSEGKVGRSRSLADTTMSHAMKGEMFVLMSI
jgi:hypothetical protein